MHTTLSLFFSLLQQCSNFNKCESSVFFFYSRSKHSPIMNEWVSEVKWNSIWGSISTLNLIEWEGEREFHRKSRKKLSFHLCDACNLERFTLQKLLQKWMRYLSLSQHSNIPTLFWRFEIENLKNVKVKWIANVWIWFCDLTRKRRSCVQLSHLQLSSVLIHHRFSHTLSCQTESEKSTSALSYTHLIAMSFLREIPVHVAFSIIFCHRHQNHHHDYYYHRSSHCHLCIGSCTSHLPSNKLKRRL